MNHAAQLLLAVCLMDDASIDHIEPKDVVCLTQNIYHEARGESIKGQIAVAHVTLNRAADTRWPSTICGVVHQNSQFSWTASGKGSIEEPAAYETAMMIALNAMMGMSKDPTNGATYFYDSKAVTPRWSRKFETVAVIGAHTFKR